MRDKMVRWSCRRATLLNSFAASLAVILFSTWMGQAPLSAAPREGRREALALLTKGQAALKAGRVEEAVESLQRSVELAPSPAAYYSLGEALRKAGRKEEAREAYEQALALNPNYELARQALGRLPAAKSESSGESVGYDAALNERETLDSLRPAEEGGGAPKAPAVLALGALLPSPSQVKSSGKASIPTPASKPLPRGAARDAVIPNAPTEVIQEVPTREIVSATMPESKERGRIATRQGQSDAHAAANDGDFSLWRGRKRASRSSVDGEKVSANASSERQSSSPERATKEAPVATISPEAVNQAAFNSDAEEKEQKRYGHPTKLLLGTFEFHRTKGDAYKKARRWVEAADEYQKALEKNPDDVVTRASLAECLAMAGEVDIAEAQFKKALEMDPNDPRVLFRMGNTYRELKRLDEAIKAYRQALNADPRNVQIRNNLGVVLMEKGDFAKAAAEFKKVLEIDSNYINAMLNLGILYDERLNDPQQAAKHYRLYIEKRGSRAKEVQQWLDALEREG